MEILMSASLSTWVNASGELAPLVGVKGLGLAITGQGIFKRRYAEISIKGVGQPLGQDLAAASPVGTVTITSGTLIFDGTVIQ